MAILMLLLGMVSAIVIVVFALQNGRIVTISFFDWSIEASLVLVIMVTALMGFLTALFFELFVQLKLRFRLYKMGRQIKSLEEELLKWKPAQKPIRIEQATEQGILPKQESPLDKTESGVK